MGRVRGCIVFNYKEWVIQKGVVESEKTEKKRLRKECKFPKILKVNPSENNPTFRTAPNLYYLR